eukprot:CAMPEP_0182491410 /NCGR_PEP_ID=MMETSP1321-20130603/869_1 /TAXON_ID=91990 /ORGANISM="Bolidomonas sp., Strain RCC1657" /LENGTH=156 /DNA_ID=CAMNT_0024693691 /DNA_START=61 /DNA_END=528 /DNA_ORIENTATION=+
MASLVENVETTPPPTPIPAKVDNEVSNVVTPGADNTAKVLTEEEMEREKKREMMAKKRKEIEARLEKKRAENAALAKAMFAGGEEEIEGPAYDPFAAKFEKPREKMNQTTTGGSKGKEGNADHTTGKCKFARPCTVGWKSQNQPLQRGGGGRTPRQ